MSVKHPSYYRKPEYFFKYLMLAVNATCNNRCKGCCGTLNSWDDMPFPLVERILREVLLVGNIKVLFPSCNAEATLYQDIIPMVELLNSFNKKNLYVRQDTNSRQIPDGFIEALNQAKYSYDIGLSLWGGDEETYFELQGPGFKDVIANMKRYLRELKTQPSISAPCITPEQNKKVLSVIEDMITDAGYKPLLIKGGALPEVLHEQKKLGYVPVISRNYTIGENGLYNVYRDDGTIIPFVTYNNCDLLYKAINIRTDGNVLPCSGVNHTHEYSIGNVFDYEDITYQDLKNMYNSEKALDFLHKNYSAGNFMGDVCKTCTARICN